ncbi:RDD family protein [Arcicella aquatica]|uniref:RDD family protein n=1 Tax=Arcicella aquatica TaxID=217141 RepID=A0ABU5QKC1_9BACT|nr:RDD family protein [Arcicella aquatica]MEA5257506.1 RDD family protein [Arcicella aquatica]
MIVQHNVNTATRLGSMILDHFIMTMIATVFFIPMMIVNISKALNASVTHEQEDMGIGFDGPLFYVSLVGFALYFCKDIIKGRSLGKVITKTQIVDNNTGQVASPLKCFIRNIFCVIWPVEVIITLTSPSRRLGDRVAGTKVITYDPINVEQPKFNIAEAIVPLVISYGLLLLLVLPFQAFESTNAKVKYVESSFNDAESKVLEKLFADSLGQNLTASVKVFDKIEENKNLKYISVIYTLKENYLEEESRKGQLNQITDELLYSKYPRITFIGQAKYVFKTSGSMEINTKQIGANVNEMYYNEAKE